MRFVIAAALSLAAPAMLAAQTVPDLSIATPIAGNWTYAATADGSEASFADASDIVQLWVHCSRAAGRVSIAKPATGGAPFLNVWTSSETRSIPSSFNPMSGRLAIDLAATDPLLDAISSSRGRIGFAVAGQPALVIPAWAEAARVVEDCRA
jgi:hypothetical protein